MIRINVPWVIEAVETFDALDTITAGSVLENIGPLIGAQLKIEHLYDQSIYKDHLRASRQAGRQLYELIGTHVDHEKWTENKLNEWEIVAIKQSKATFKTVLLADLGVSPTYVVARKDNFDVSLLVDDGARLFPPGILAKAPETEKDAKEIGRALAYELPTAAGFHTFRVTESVVRRYWDNTNGIRD